MRGVYKMPNEKAQLVNVLRDLDFWIFTTLFIAGTVSLAMKKKNNNFSMAEFIGEAVLALGMAFICWVFGLYQGLDSMQITLLALPAAYGQVNLLFRLVQAKGALLNDRPAK